MMKIRKDSLGEAIHTAGQQLLDWGKEVDVGEWHSQDVRGVEQAVSVELLNVSIEAPIPRERIGLEGSVRPNLPWAEDHFMERVGGSPLNPPPSHSKWPWASANEKHQTQEGRAFSHSYPERMWPKWAEIPIGRHSAKYREKGYEKPHRGIRFAWGDLGDVVGLLARSPYTRQAFLPIWFPEDTGVVHGERVPCTIGYHFILRDDKLHVVYYIRSCDFMRYFRDDIYLACRLCQWMIEEVGMKETDYLFRGAVPGNLTMHITSLHCFKGDLPKLQKEYS